MWDIWVLVTLIFVSNTIASNQSIYVDHNNQIEKAQSSEDDHEMAERHGLKQCKLEKLKDLRTCAVKIPTISYMW